MSEYKIQKPCDNCELKFMLESEGGLSALALEGLYMAVFESDALYACKHPWRLLNEAYNNDPDNVQVQVLSKSVQVRGKNPTDYGLPVIDKISTLDF